MSYGMVSECFRCGISGDKSILYDAIGKEGVIYVCEKCSIQDDIPVIKRPTKFQLNTSVTPYTVYERLSRMAGLNPGDHKSKVTRENYERGRTEKGQEASLRQIVDKGLQKKSQEEKEERDDLVNNFHWVVLRARRLRKLTQDQVAKEIDEPVTAIMSMERGIVPKDRPAIVSKLETFFRIRLNKETQIPHSHAGEKQVFETKELKPRISPKDVKFDRESAGKLTIADLKELKKEMDTKISSPKMEVEEDVVFEEDIFEKEEK